MITTEKNTFTIHMPSWDIVIKGDGIIETKWTASIIDNKPQITSITSEMPNESKPSPYGNIPPYFETLGDPEKTQAKAKEIKLKKEIRAAMLDVRDILDRDESELCRCPACGCHLELTLAEPIK